MSRLLKDSSLEYKNGNLHLEEINLNKLAEIEKTPLYVYSKNRIKNNFNNYIKHFNKDFLVCYSVKANSNLNILKYISELGGGFDVVSAGELFKALKTGVDPQKMIFSGVCKTEEELEFALRSNILMVNVESINELEALNAIAERFYKNKNKKAVFGIRINPDINPKTHPYISTGLKENKFGIGENELIPILQNLDKFKSLKLIGLSYHIGSQILTLEPFIESVNKALNFIKKNNLDITYLNIGGGLGIQYNCENFVSIDQYMQKISSIVKNTGLKLIIEPGRSIIGNAGILLGKIYYIKTSDTKKFYVTDIGMNDFLRPMLYGAYHTIIPCIETNEEQTVDMVGPVCESGDRIFENRRIHKIGQGAYFAVLSCGAYGFVMSSNYNSRPKCSEIFVDGKNYRVIRKRETYEDLLRGEKYEI